MHRSFLPDINYALVRFPNVCRPPTSFYDPSPDLIVVRFLFIIFFFCILYLLVNFSTEMSCFTAWNVYFCLFYVLSRFRFCWPAIIGEGFPEERLLTHIIIYSLNNMYVYSSVFREIQRAAYESTDRRPQETGVCRQSS